MIVGNASALITIDSVYVGDIGNPNDPTTGYGTVGYGYGIGKYEVTLNQYCAFLNAVGATDTYGLYNPQMGLDGNIMGISRSGSSGSYGYSVIGSGNRPVTYVSWFDAARFVNWLHNGQPTGGQTAATTEEGAYMLDGAISGVTFTRNSGATYVLPSENEWYKAAFYQPASAGGDSDGYWLFPTASNQIPNSRNGGATDSNSANFWRDDNLANGFNGGYAVTDSTDYSSSQNYLTGAGAFSQADGYYGTFDQGGNVREWNDTVPISALRGMSGGAWGSNESSLRAHAGSGMIPTFEDPVSGFRVAMVPEPTVVGLIALGAALVALKRKRPLRTLNTAGRELRFGNPRQIGMSGRRRSAWSSDRTFGSNVLTLPRLP
jgi:formylglycine-generating enzyme